MSMAQQIILMIVDCIKAVNSWFLSVLDSSGMYSIVVAFIAVTLSARFILMPIVGGAFFRAASDRVKKSHVGEKEK